MAIGEGWVNGAWVDAGWVTGAWAQAGVITIGGGTAQLGVITSAAALTVVVVEVSTPSSGTGGVIRHREWKRFDEFLKRNKRNEKQLREDDEIIMITMGLIELDLI